MSTTSSIGTSGGRNYSTINAWISAGATMSTTGWIGQTYNDSEFNGGDGVGGKVYFTGITTSATNPVALTTAPGQSFRDNAGAQTNALRYNQSNGVGIKITGGYTVAIDVNLDYVTLQYLQVAVADGRYSSEAISNEQVSAAHGLIDSCIAESAVANVSTGVVSWFGGGKIINSLIVSHGNGARGLWMNYAGGSVISCCTIVRPSDLTPVASALRSDSGTVTIVNTAGYGFSSFSSGAGTCIGNNNSSDQVIAFGTSNQASKTFTAQFENTLEASADWRQASGGTADLYNNGATDSTNIPAAIDIVGTSRPQSTAWDIGCWELIPGSPPPTGHSRLPMMGIG